MLRSDFEIAPGVEYYKDILINIKDIILINCDQINYLCKYPLFGIIT